MVVDLSDTAVTGTLAEESLEDCGIVLNRNVVPADAKQPGKSSGIRIGTGGITARGMGKEEILMIGNRMDQLIQHPEDSKIHGR